MALSMHLGRTMDNFPLSKEISLSIILLIILNNAEAVMITKQCPYEETHKSCLFYAEYTCWETEAKETRVKAPAKRVLHCWAGCVCRPGWVRAYPGGPCVPANTCVDRFLMATISKLPNKFIID